MFNFLFVSGIDIFGLNDVILSYRDMGTILFSIRIKKIIAVKETRGPMG